MVKNNLPMPNKRMQSNCRVKKLNTIQTITGLITKP